jgi:integrase
MLTNSVPSRHTRRAYEKAFDDLLALTIRTGQPISRQLFQQYRAEMVDAGLGGSTINVRLSGVRKLVKEARENDLIDPSYAGRILSVPNVPAQGVRLGQWLTAEQTRDLLAVPDRNYLKGKRDHSILSCAVQTALRREELSHLGMSHIQMRDGRWVIADSRRRTRLQPLGHLPFQRRARRSASSCGRAYIRNPHDHPRTYALRGHHLRPLWFHATPTSAKYPMPAATRPRIFRNRGAARSEPRLPVAILWVINPRAPPVAQKILHGALPPLISMASRPDFCANDRYFGNK